MSKTIEQGSNKLTTWLGNATALPTKWVFPLASLCIAKDRQVLSFGKEEVKSLYYNGYFYLRLMLPFWIGFSIRWRASDGTKKDYLQVGLGWKLNGRLGAICRIQSDVASATGVSGPNVDQATGFLYGTK